MGPPTSPAKKSAKENDNNKEDNNNTKDDDYAYQLVLIGKQAVVSQQCFKDYQVFSKPWSESPFTVGRADFAQVLFGAVRLTVPVTSRASCAYQSAAL